jgi:hypothetical protein
MLTMSLWSLTESKGETTKMGEMIKQMFDNCYITVGGLQEWSYMRYPPWAHGPGYVISRDVAKFVVEGHQKLLLKVHLPISFYNWCGLTCQSGVNSMLILD